MITEEEIQFQRNWSATASEVATYDRVITLILKRAGEAFADCKDIEARILRNLALELKPMKEAASKNLSTFIKENREKREKQKLAAITAAPQQNDTEKHT